MLCRSWVAAVITLADRTALNITYTTTTTVVVTVMMDIVRSITANASSIITAVREPPDTTGITTTSAIGLPSYLLLLR